MIRPVVALAATAGLVVAVAALAEAPKIAEITPTGARRGVPTELAITGTRLEGSPRLLLPFAAEVAAIPAPDGKADAARWSLRITPAADTPIGIYPVRVRTDDGLSNPFLLAVGQVPEVAEAEENGSFEAAQAIPTPVVVNGGAAGNDVDYFRFSGKKGQRIVVDAQCARIGSNVDPSIRLTTAAHGFVASADDTPGLLTDARLSAELPQDGDYVIELSDTRYAAAGRAVYRLLVGSVPVADEVFPLGGRKGETIGLELRGGTLAAPGVIAATLTPDPKTPEVFRPRWAGSALGTALAPGDPGLDVESLIPLAVDVLPELREPADPAAPPLRATPPVVLNGRIESRGREDRYILAVSPGQKLRVAVDAAELGSALDGVLQVRGPQGGVLATADDTTTPAASRKKGAAAKKAEVTISADPSLDVTVPANTSEITLCLRDLRGEGGAGYPYRITVSTIAPGFSLELSESQASIPKGGTFVLEVDAARQDFAGPIALAVPDLPAGLTARTGGIREGQAKGVISLTAAPDAAFDVVDLKVEGKGDGGPAGPLAAVATRDLVFARQETLPTNVSTQLGLPAASARPLGVTLDAPAGPIELVHGHSAPIPIKVVREPGAEDAALAIGSLTMPPGLTLAASKIEPKAAEAAATIASAVDGPLGLWTIALTAKGPIKGREELLGIPAVAVNVVRPAEISLAAPAVEIKAGGTAEVKGTIARKGPFKDPVTVKVDGLPAGIKADPPTVVVPPDQSEYTLKLVAEPTAAVAAAEAKVGMAFPIAGKDYPTPPIPLSVKVVAAP
ncbi:PPC domain-containing protein [Tundrisphaera sp. TA3]|uniref:PPC domain-containing protein n=1 Tax=Tundrisphaera sp. TA3 TaxID=3435775 RepID=UPI003EC079FF